jgi:Protein phosphatase 2C
MMSERDPAPWPVITGTARGSTHEARQLPNQDSAGSRPIAGGAGVVAAVADGHGASRHFRSAAGSMLAVRAALTVVSELTDEAALPWNAELAGTLRGTLPEAVLARWRELVAAHLAAHPYTPQEQSELGARGDTPEIPYGSTLIFALIAGDWLVCAQIGDGDLVAIRPDGEAWAPVSGDAHLDGYHTTSLCQADAARSFRAGAYDLRTEPLLALLLSTDGFGNAQATDPWQPVLARDLAELAVQHGRRWFEHQLPVWARRCASAEGSGDDTTIALLLAPNSQSAASAAADAADLALAEQAPDGAGERPSPWAPQSPSARRRAEEAAQQRPYRSSAFPPQPHRPPPGPLSPHHRARARFSWPWLVRHRALIAGIAVLLIAAAGIAAGLLASQASGSAPVTHPTGQPAPKASQLSSAATVPAATAGVKQRASATGHPPAQNQEG